MEGEIPPLPQTALLERARQAGLDADSLLTCLEAVRATATDALPIIPVGAYAARAENRRVWIIVAKWELEDMGDHGMSHFRAWAFDAQTTEELGFVTCE